MEDLKTEARISPYLHPFRLVNINIHVEEWDQETRYGDSAHALKHHEVVKPAERRKFRTFGHVV